MAGPVLRAGLTDVLVTGMLTRWIKVSASPIARPAAPAVDRWCVAPRMTIRNMKRHHDFGNNACQQRILSGRVLAVAVGGEAAGQAEVRLSTGNQIENARADDRADDLGDDVAQELVRGKRPPAHRPTDTAGLKCPPEIGPSAYAPVRHGEAERERDAEKADAHAGKRGREHRTPAAAQHQPERTDEFSEEFRSHWFHLERSGRVVELNTTVEHPKYIAAGDGLPYYCQ